MVIINQPVKLRDDVLPTELEIYKHYLYLNNEKLAAGEWTTNTPLSKKVELLMVDVSALWHKTGIPFLLAGAQGERRIMALFTRCKKLNKVAMVKRGEKFGQDLNVLFDVASCKHEEILCSCSKADQVPPTWKEFLADQRGQRQMVGVLSDRSLTLRTAKSREKAVEEAKEIIRYNSEELKRKSKKEDDRKRKEQENIEILLSKVPIELRDVELEEEEDDNFEDTTEDRDSDWEDMDIEQSKSKYQNTISLKNFARECERYKVGNRPGAKIGNGLLKDLGMVNKNNKELLICPSKLRRERKKWGAKSEGEESPKKLPQGFYTDGKKVPTLVRQTVENRIQVPGRRGRAAYKTVTKTSNTVVVEDHYPVVAEPGGSYITHMTPEEGTGYALAKEIVDVINERDIDIRVIGMDGCAVNTGIHNGAIRWVEVMVGQAVQHAICGLHLVELVFWHILSETDGVTKGPDSFSGPVGSTLTQNIWEDPVVNFAKIEGNVLDLPEEVVKELSRDQRLGYRYAKAIQSGVMPDDLAGQVIGPMITSRWNTAAVRVLCKYTRTKKPTQRLIRLTKAVLKLYFPGWFRFKCYPHIQEGARNFFTLVELSRDLQDQDMIVAQAVLQNNAHWAHPENIIISMLSDAREELRRRAVLYIMKARREHIDDTGPRQFVLPKVKFHASGYFDLCDLEMEPCSEPPLTMDMDLNTIMGAFMEPIILPPYPNNTQAVERLVRVVTEVAPKKAGYTERHRMILQLLKSRELVPKFDTKKDDAVF